MNVQPPLTTYSQYWVWSAGNGEMLLHIFVFTRNMLESYINSNAVCVWVEGVC